MSGEIVHVGASSGALAQIVGTGNVREGLRRVEENVRDVIEVCRQRGFVQTYGGGREFFGLPAWQLLGMAYGLLPFVEWTRPLGGDGWEARAVVRTVEGTDVGAAEAMCTRNEPNRRRSNDHDLRAMAQTRAQRNALRSVLGSALVLAGFDFADPDAPATRDQITALWTLTDLHGWTHDEAHERAGVGSLLALTREQASELIDRWGVEDATPTNEPGTPRDLDDADEVVTRQVDAATSSAQSAEPPERTDPDGSAQIAPGIVAAPPVAPEAGEDRGKVSEPAEGADRDAWRRYDVAYHHLARVELAPALLRRVLKAAEREYPPMPDWPPELLVDLALVLEASAPQ